MMKHDQNLKHLNVNVLGCINSSFVLLVIKCSMGKCEMDSNGAEWDPVTGCCGDDN